MRPEQRGTRATGERHSRRSLFRRASKRQRKGECYGYPRGYRAIVTVHNFPSRRAEGIATAFVAVQFVRNKKREKETEIVTPCRSFNDNHLERCSIMMLAPRHLSIIFINFLFCTKIISYTIKYLQRSRNTYAPVLTPSRSRIDPFAYLFILVVLYQLVLGFGLNQHW